MKPIYPVLALTLVLLAGCAAQGKTLTSQNGKFVIEADDEGFYSGGEGVSGISVKKGAEVSITFNVLTEKVYYAGLGFKGCGTVSPDAQKGESVEMKFTPEEPCQILSYWPANGAPKKTLVVTVE